MLRTQFCETIVSTLNHMKAIYFTVFTFLLLGNVFAQGDAGRKKEFNLENGVALQGYDPVSYFQGMPIEGKEKISYVFRGVTYYFSSPTNQQTFKASPEKFEPAYGGWCAYAMGQNGEKVKIDPETFKIIDGHLFLFYNFWGTNTLKTWNKNETTLKTNADHNWQKLIQSH